MVLKYNKKSTYSVHFLFPMMLFILLLLLLLLLLMLLLLLVLLLLLLLLLVFQQATRAGVCLAADVRLEGGADHQIRASPSGSISPAFYKQLLRAQIPKAQKKLLNWSVFFALLRKSCL